MRKKRSPSYLFSSDEEPSLNLTPLIDVVFVVLILFILVAPMLEVDKIDLATAATKQLKHPVSNSSPLTVHVYSDNSIWIRSKKITSEQLLAVLKEEKKTKPSQIPQLFHDRKAQFGTYQVVKNAMEAAGFEELDIILQPGKP